MKTLVKASKQSLSLICILALLAASFAHAFAQQPASQTKRPLTHQDYDSWRSIQAPQISRDGKFIAYASMPEDGDGEIVVRNLVTGIDSRSARGYHPPVPPPDDPGANIAEFQAAQARLVRTVFTADSRFIVFSIEPTKTDVNKAKKAGNSPTAREGSSGSSTSKEIPKNALGIMDLSNGQVTRIENVRSFQVPEDGSGFIAYLLEPKPEQKKPEERGSSPTPGSPAGQPGGGGTVREGVRQSQTTTSVEASLNTTSEASASPAAQAPPSSRAQSSEAEARPSGRAQKKKEYGSDLILRNTTGGTERTFNDVLDYTLSKDAKTLLFAVASKKEETNGVYAVTPQSDAAPVSLLAGKGKYQKLTWDEDQTELAFLSDRDDQQSKQAKFKVYLWERGS